MKISKIFFWLIVFLFFNRNIYSQIKQGEILIHGATGYGITATYDNGYCITGGIDSMGLGNVYVAKLDSNGVLLWSKAIGGGYPYSDGGFSIIQAKDRGYTIAGTTSAFNVNHYDKMYIIKLDSSGRLKWTQTIGGVNYEEGYSLIEASDGGYVITGSENSFAPQGIYVVKVDTGGNIKWTKTIGGVKAEEGESIIRTNDKGYAIAGNTYSYGAAVSNNGSNVYIVKLDSNGNLQWTKTIGGKINDISWGIVQTKDNGYAIAGDSWSYGDTVHGDVYAIKLDSSGNLKWAEAIGGNKSDGSRGITGSYDGGCVITGFTYSYGDTVNGSLYLIKLDTAGKIEWTRVIGGSYSTGEAIIQTRDSGFAITGVSNKEGYFLKLDKYGKSCSSYDSGGIVTKGGLVSSGGAVSSGGIVQRGGTINNAGSIATNLCVITGNPSINQNDIGINICPNPATYKVTIESPTYLTTAKFFDITGRLILTQRMNSNHEIDISKIHSGIYFLQLSDEKTVTITKKVIKL